MRLKIFGLLTSLIAMSLSIQALANPTDFVRVDNGRFMIGETPYRYVGTNFWYGAILGSKGRGGDRDRLNRELDLLQANGIDNLRVLVGADGEENIPSHIMPVLQKAPGVYNDTILDGLDYLMAELERRDMKAILFLNNAWEWSGGYGTYLDWAGDGKTPIPATEGYDKYMKHVARFVHNEKAKQMAADHVRNMVTRVNRYTGKPYSESPALMSWQIANEPRAFADDQATKDAFANWISSQAALIKSLDSNHLVSTGSEGSHGCEFDIDLWNRIHQDPNIDYAIMHLWPYNWGWVNEQNLTDNVGNAIDNAYQYIMNHSVRARANNKPLVIEEFGYPRDGFQFAIDSLVTGRDKFYEYIFSLVEANDNIGGCNFWSWGGYARPAHLNWEPWDDYTGDPAQEQQGLNSVFATDQSTLDIIRRTNDRLKNTGVSGETPETTVVLSCNPDNDWWSPTTDAPTLTIKVHDLTGVASVTPVTIEIRGDREDAPVYFSGVYDVNHETNAYTPAEFNAFPILPGPGFYRVKATAEGAKPIEFNIGVQPTAVISEPDAPKDLRKFWDKALKELSKVPMNARMVELPEKSSDKRKIYFCQYLSIDNDTVSGYLAVPTAPGKYPAIIYYNGYNGTPWDLDPDGMPDYIEFQHWVRGQGPNKPYNRYGDWIQYNLNDPSHYYYRSAFMDAIRTIDFIESLPQTDTDNIFAEGGSQGGAFTFAAAALDPKQRLRAIAPYIPFLSDYPDYFEIVHWPGDVVKNRAKELGMTERQMYDNLRYFDIKNLTPWIKVPVLMGVGLQDPTCPPHTNFAGYNNLGNVDKDFVIYPLCGHTVDYTDWNPRRLEFFERNRK